MSDPATGIQIGVSTLTQLTQLVAAHGVYALTILAIFILQRRAAASLRKATTQDDKDYYRKHNNWATLLAYGLIVVATGIWFYGNFIHKATCVVQGSIRGLKDQTIAPQGPDDPPYRVHRVSNYRRDVDFYFNKEAEEGSEGYVLDWALVASARKDVLLTFQQQVRTWKRPGPFDLPDLGGSSRSKLASRTISGVFKLEVEDPRKLEGTRVHLQYSLHPDDPHGKLGTLKLVAGTEFVEIPWLDESSIDESSTLAARRALSLGLAAPAWARAVAQTEGEAAPPEPAERAKRWRLLSLLGSGDLSDQLLGKQLLLKQGPKAHALMEELLAEGDTRGYDRELLVYNLSAVAAELDRAGSPPPPEVRKSLAEKLWELRDPAAAALHYEMLTYKELTSDWDLYRKGVSLLEAGRFESAIPPLERFLEVSDSALGAEVAARYALGSAYAKTNRPDEAIVELRKVLELGVRDSQRPPTLVALAGALTMRGEQEEAASIFDELVDFDPHSVEHLELLADLYSDVGVEPENVSRLREDARKLRELKPEP